MGAGLTDKDSMVSGQNIVPWHKMGKVVAGLMTTEEVLGEAGLTWAVAKEPVKRGGDVVPGWHFTVRSDTNDVLGIVGDRYTVIQNKQGLDVLDALVGTGDAIYDTAGSLFGGRKVWIAAKPERQVFYVKDEEYQPYILFTTSHDGSGGVTAANVVVRVVCANTLAAALAGARKIVSVRHTMSATSKLEEAKRIMSINVEYVEAMRANAERLVAAKMDKAEFKTFLDVLVPVPTVETDTSGKEVGATRGRTLAMNTQEVIGGLYFNAANLEKITGTRWGALNAVAEFENHAMSGRNTSKNGDNRAENAFERTVFENNIVHRAYDLLKV